MPQRLRFIAVAAAAILIITTGERRAEGRQGPTAPPKGTQTRPQGQGAISKPLPAKTPATPATRTPPAPEPARPYPAIPATPQTLELTGNTVLRQGDSWTYLVSSSNPQMDGKLLRVTLTERGETSATVTFGGDGLAQTEVRFAWNGVGWFSPVTDADGKIGIKLFWKRPPTWTAQGPGTAVAQGEAKAAAEEEADAARILNFPIKVEAGRYTSFDVSGRWEHNFVTGVRKEWPGSALEISGPETCVVPAGAFASGVFAFDGPSGRMRACFEPSLPVAVRARSMPRGGAGWLLFELHSYESAGASKQPEFPDLPAAERQKALDWLRGKTTPGKAYDPVAVVLAVLHENVRSHPRDIVRIFMSPGVTNDDKGYVVEWKAWTFSVREMTPAEVSADPRESIRTRIDAGKPDPGQNE